MKNDSARNIYRRVRTIATECLHKVFEDKLGSEIGSNWFITLVNENADLLKGAKNIYSCNLTVLLAVLSGPSASGKLVSDTAEKPEIFLEIAKKALTTLANLHEESIDNLESEKFNEAAAVISALIDQFPSVRDDEGVTFISKIIHRSAPLKSEEQLPTYSIEKTIEKVGLDVTVSEFIDCCLPTKTGVIFDGKESIFLTEKYEAVIESVSEYIKKRNAAAKSKATKLLLLKIAAGVLAVVIAVISATISHAITNATANKKYQELLSSSLNDAVNNLNGIKNETNLNENKNQNTNTPSNDDTQNNEDHSVNTDSSNSSGENDTPSTTVNTDGRIKKELTIPYRYDGSKFVMHSIEDEDLGDVYATLQSYYFDSFYDKQIFNLYIYNKSENMIRNVGIEIDIIDESGATVFTYKEDKILANNSSVSIESNSSYYLSKWIKEEDIAIPDADLGFCTFKTTIYYDIV